MLKKPSGITLISLIITIIVLVILTGVAVNTLSGSGSIIENANRVISEYNSEVARENEELARISNYLNGYIDDNNDDNNDDDDENILDSNGYLTQKYDFTSSTNTDLKITIPRGFALLNSSGNIVTDINDYATIVTDTNITETGIVVKAADGSEFVWVPVQDVTQMYWTSGTRKVGQLYITNSGNQFGTKRTQYDTTGGIGEATIVSADSGDYNTITSGENKQTALLAQFQTEFEAMITSVETYGGFYVGRYETSVINNAVKSVKTTDVDQILRAENNSSKAQCVSSWYGLYNKAKQYSTDAGITSVATSCMIWGCAYDQIMLWMQGNSINVKNTEKTQGNFGSNYINTGSNNSYKFNNIYDLCGNHQEWTMTSMWSGRALRGGHKGSGTDYCSMSSAEGVEPSAVKSEATTRIQLYLNV